MSVATFIPSVWEAALLQNYYEQSSVDAITFRPTRIEGNKIIYNRVGNVAIKDYKAASRKVTWDTLDTSKVELNIDQEKYWAFIVDDIDEVQAAGPLQAPHVIEAANKMAMDTDTFVFNDITNNATNTLTLGALDETNAYAAMVDLNRSLDKRNIPTNDRFLVINWDVLAMIEKDPKFVYANAAPLHNGLMMAGNVAVNINGSQVLVTNNLPANKLIAIQKSAYGFAPQLQKTEAMRMESTFGDGIRGLMVYGGKIIRDESVTVATFS